MIFFSTIFLLLKSIFHDKFILWNLSKTDIVRRIEIFAPMERDQKRFRWCLLDHCKCVFYLFIVLYRGNGDENHPWVRLINKMIGVGDEENILITLEHSSATTQLTDDVSNFIGLIHSFFYLVYPFIERCCNGTVSVLLYLKSQARSLFLSVELL